MLNNIFQAKTKKPMTKPGAKIAAPQIKKKKSSDSIEIPSNSASSSREKLNGSSEKIFKPKPLKKEASPKQPVSLPVLEQAKASPKKHSFGKSTPPPKPKPPSITSKGSTGRI